MASTFVQFSKALSVGLIVSALTLIVAGLAVVITGGPQVPSSPTRSGVEAAALDLGVSYELARAGQASVYFLSGDELRVQTHAWEPGLSAAEFALQLRESVHAAWLETPPQAADWSAANTALRELATGGAIPSRASPTRDQLSLVFVHTDPESLWIVPAEAPAQLRPSEWERADQAFETALQLEGAWNR